MGGLESLPRSIGKSLQNWRAKFVQSDVKCLLRLNTYKCRNTVKRYIQMSHVTTNIVKSSDKSEE
jgi:hypothetical protein